MTESKMLEALERLVKAICAEFSCLCDPIDVEGVVSHAPNCPVAEAESVIREAPTPEQAPYKVPDTPDYLATWVWQHYVGIPLTESHDAEFTRLFDRIEALNRQAFTAGLREAMRQFKESEENRAKVAGAGNQSEQAAPPELAKCPQCDAPNEECAGEMCSATETVPGCEGFCPMTEFIEWPTQAEFDARKAAELAAADKQVAEGLAEEQAAASTTDERIRSQCWKCHKPVFWHGDAWYHEFGADVMKCGVAEGMPDEG